MFRNDSVLLDLEHCWDIFSAPLMNTIESLSGKITGGSDAAGQIIQAQTLCCKIFYSLNCLDLYEFFEDNVEKWTKEFTNYLTVSVSCDDSVGFIDDLRAAACDNLRLFMERDPELFEKYMTGFLDVVRDLLLVGSPSDRLAASAINFLIVLNANGLQPAWFSGDQALQQILECFVIPNVMLRDEDQHVFETNHLDSLKRNMDSINGRRTRACDLVKNIARNYQQDVFTHQVSEHIISCLAPFYDNPAANWKYKDCVIYMVDYLRASLSIVDVESFFTAVIMPELHCQDVNAFPVLKAAALKFFITFRFRIPRPLGLAALGDVVRFLASDANTVHSYAASCINNLLFVMIDGVMQPRYTSAEISPILPVLTTNLFGALEKPGSEDNPHIMRCIIVAVQIADISPERASPCMITDGLTRALNRVCCKNPKNPAFNRCLHEAVATLIRRVWQANPCLVVALETSFLPILQTILVKHKDIEFFPYALQLLVQLVDLNKPAVPPHYIHVFDIILWTPDLWEESANVPDLFRLLHSFLQQASPDELNREGRLKQIALVFSILVSSPCTGDQQGFLILSQILENLGYDIMADEYMKYIWASLFSRLRNSNTPTLVRNLIIFMSLFIVKHGLETLVDSINSFQENLFNVILCHLWIPNLKTITGSYIEVKLSAVASSNLLCTSPSLLDPAAEEQWGKLLDGIVTLLISQPEEELAEARVEDEPVFGSYQTAGKKDPLAEEIKDPKHFLVALLEILSSKFPGRFMPVITRYLSPANQASLVQLCSFYDLSIV